MFSSRFCSLFGDDRLGVHVRVSYYAQDQVYSKLLKSDSTCLLSGPGASREMLTDMRADGTNRQHASHLFVEGCL